MKIRKLVFSNMVFENRIHAGEVLAGNLAKLKLNSQKSLIAAIPRGGVVIGEVIAAKLKIPLTVIVIKKLGAPFNPELAIGATAAHGKPVLDRWLIADLGVSADYLKKEIIKKKKEAAAREKNLGVVVAPNQYKVKVVIVVDDGVATGQTVRAAAKIIRAFDPAGLYLAVGCASPQVIDQLNEDFDKIICPLISADLVAVGQFYRDFRPISDEEVKFLLQNRLTANH